MDALQSKNPPDTTESRGRFWVSGLVGYCADTNSRYPKEEEGLSARPDGDLAAAAAAMGPNVCDGEVIDPLSLLAPCPAAALGADELASPPRSAGGTGVAQRYVFVVGL